MKFIEFPDIGTNFWKQWEGQIINEPKCIWNKNKIKKKGVENHWISWHRYEFLKTMRGTKCKWAIMYMK